MIEKKNMIVQLHLQLQIIYFFCGADTLLKTYFIGEFYHFVIFYNSFIKDLLLCLQYHKRRKSINQTLHKASLYLLSPMIN